jgi:predicted Zn-dependent protease
VRPDDATAALHEGQALEKLHDLAGARAALESSLKLVPGQFPARLLLGQTYLGLKDPKAAEDQFEAALLLQPNNPDALLGVATAQIAEGNFAEAVQQLETLSKTRAKNAAIFDLLAKAYAGLGNAAEARQAEAKAKLLRQHSKQKPPQ